MSRTLSTNAKQAINSQESSEVFLMLLSIAHTSFAATYRFVRNTVDVVSRGNTYTAYPFEVILPDSIGDSMPDITLRIDNVSREIINALRALTSTPTLTLEVVLASSPNTIEAGPFSLRIKTIDYDVGAVEATLIFEECLTDAFPADSFTPDLYPGLF